MSVADVLSSDYSWNSSEHVESLQPISESGSSYYERISEIKIVIENFSNLVKEDAKWESEKLTSYHNYPFKLIIRPNGLRFTKGHKKCVGIWFKPLPYNLSGPANVRLMVQAVSPTNSEVEGLIIPMKEYTWTEEDIIGQNPAFCFDLTAITHSAIKQENCIGADKSLTLYVHEEIEVEDSEVSHDSEVGYDSEMSS